jgi:hypothetical protein
VIKKYTFHQELSMIVTVVAEDDEAAESDSAALFTEAYGLADDALKAHPVILGGFYDDIEVETTDLCGRDYMAGQVCMLPYGHEGGHR